MQINIWTKIVFKKYDDRSNSTLNKRSTVESESLGGKNKNNVSPRRYTCFTFKETIVSTFECWKELIVDIVV